MRLMSSVDQYLAMGYDVGQAIKYAVQDSCQRDLDTYEGEPYERQFD